MEEVKTPRKLTVAVAMLAMFGCDDGSGNSGTAAMTPKAVSDAALSGAPFRHVARGVYAALLTESCEVNRALRRESVLASEIAAVGKFEETARSGPVADQLRVAQSDVGYQRTSGKLGCWEDSDPRFAQVHLKMARDDVRTGLRDMKRMASGFAAVQSASAGFEPSAGAEFRSLVRALVQRLQPLCQVVETASNDQIMAPARAELARFRQRIQGTPHAFHYALAEADALYESSLMMVECSDPGTGSAAGLTRNALEEARRQIADMTMVTRH